MGFLFFIGEKKMVLSPILKKLMFVRQFDIDKGKVTLLGQRQIMLDASVLLELQDIDESKLYDVAKKAGFSNIKGIVQHAKVYGRVKEIFSAEITDLGKKIGETDEGTIKTLEEIFDLYGLGEMNIEEIDNDKKQAIVSVRESVIAEEWIGKNKKKSKEAVCSLTAGILAGVFSFIFEKKVDCVEAKCKAQGNSNCLFKVA